VDDDPDVRDSLARALRHAGYAVTTAVHGADALDSVARSPVDLIVLDVLMPMVDGFDACRRLRERGDATPVLLLTAREDGEERDARPRRLSVDQGNGLLYPPLLKPQRDPDIVMAGLHDDKRGR
jgi:CheY-like chemotaxis protein